MKRLEKVELVNIKSTLLTSDSEDERILSLAEALKDGYLLDAPVLRKGEDGYEIIKGEKVIKAALINGLDKIEAVVFDSDDHQVNVAIVDSLQRGKTDAISEALQMQKVMQEERLTQSELASRLGLKQSTIANKLRLLHLPINIQEAIISGLITERHGRALLKVDEEKVQEVFDVIVERHYNVARTEEYLNALNKRGNRGVSGSVQVGINTLKQAFDLCQKSGLDCVFNTRETAGEIKVVISFKK